MFEKYRLDNRLRQIGSWTEEVAQINAMIVKNKLSLYKQLLRNPLDVKVVEGTSTLLEAQIHNWNGLREIILNLRPETNLEGELSGLMKSALEVLFRGRNMLNRIIFLISAQRDNLKKNNFQAFKSNFKEELAIYKEYESMMSNVPDELLHEMRVALKERKIDEKHTPKFRSYIANVILFVIFSGLFSFYDPSLFKNRFGNLKNALLTLGIMVAWTFVSSNIYKELAKLRLRIKAYR
jgi:hypothetical protein